MTLNSSSDIKDILFSSIRKKIGNVHIHLESTPNAKARLTIGTHRKDFVNQSDALNWLIYTYNIKALKKSVRSTLPKVEFKSSVIKKRGVLNNAANKLFEKIIELDYYSTEIYRNVVSDFEKLKTDEDFSDQEVGLVYGIVIELLQKLMDETYHHKRSQVYKKYLVQLNMRGKRRG